MTVALATALAAPVSADGDLDADGLRPVPLPEGSASFALGSDETLVGRATTDGFQLAVGRLGGAPAWPGGPGLPSLPRATGFAECQVDVPQTSAFAATPEVPLAAPNRASAGECPLQIHPGSIQLLHFRTAGNLGGFLWIWDPAGSFYVDCRSTGAQLGAGAPGAWAAPEPPTAACEVHVTGATPDQFTAWTASAYNGHSLGTTYVFVAGLPHRDQNEPR